jgi:hypothetical protein
MKPAYFTTQASGRDRWMISYVDVLTIPLILFVAMAARALQSAGSRPQSLRPFFRPPGDFTDGRDRAGVEREHLM